MASLSFTNPRIRPRYLEAVSISGPMAITSILQSFQSSLWLLAVKENHYRTMPIPVIHLLIIRGVKEAVSMRKVALEYKHSDSKIED